MITVVNMIPQSLSGETNQDSEPNLAVNPADPRQIAASAFTPNPGGGPNAPIYISTDGGATWSLNSIVPSAGGIGTGDITLRFTGTSSRFFAAILDGASGDFEVHRSSDFTTPTVMTQLESRSDEDQPYIQAATVMGGANAGTDRVYIGVNDFNASAGRTATIEQSLDAGATPPLFSSSRIETRSTSGQDGAQVRPAVHADGTIYAAFYRWITTAGSFPANTFVVTNADLIVVRDDNWAAGASPFSALTDTSDGLAGRRVATALTFPFNQTGVAANGQERWGGDISIAVDPRNSSTVYVAHSTVVAGVYTLRVNRSTDRGVTWSPTLLSVPNAKNPALAINSLGKIGWVYQQITGTGATQRWETHFRDSTDGTTWSDQILCTALSQAPARTFSPYVGDYLHMMAVGKDFYGIFSANNTPDLSSFPQGVTYQRNHDFATRRLFALDGATPVAPSIDPFFFKVGEFAAETASDFYVRDWTDSPTAHDTGLEPSTHPVFYATSDVWNQRVNGAPSFVNDQPQSHDPQNDATNFAFARISRNEAGGAETVNVEFLVAEFGTGSPYASVASTSATFAAGETSKVVSAAWTLAPTTSTHLCLAVQVSTTADPFVIPGLDGRTPGWPTTDLLVINDNNKAQRNMSVHYGLSGFGSTSYAIVRNASESVRDVVLEVEVDGRALQAWGAPTVRAQGERKARPLERSQELTLAQMRPGERRWIEFRAAKVEAKTGRALAVDIRETVDGKVINGFRFGFASVTQTRAVQEILLFNRAVFRRLQARFGLDEAVRVIQAADKLLKTKRPTLAAYVKLMAAERKPIEACVEKLLAKWPDDQATLDVKASMAALDTSLARRPVAGAVLAAHRTLVEQVDVAITLMQKAREAPVSGPGQDSR